MNTEPITTKSKIIILLNILLMLGFITYLFILHENVSNRTQSLAWIIQQKNYSPRLERNLIYAEECTNRYRDYDGQPTQEVDESLLICYNHIDIVRVQALAYPRWKNINNEIEMFDVQTGITKEVLLSLNQQITESGSVTFKINEDIKIKLISNLKSAHELIHKLLNDYQTSYPDREPLKHNPYYFKGNFLEQYVICFRPGRLGFTSWDDCNKNLSFLDYATPPAVN